MARTQSVRRIARAVTDGTDPRAAVQEELQSRLAGGESRTTTRGETSAGRDDGMDPADFPAAKDQGGAGTDTVMEQKTVPLDDAGEALNRSEQRRDGMSKVHVICPMVIPRGRSLLSMFPVLLLMVVVAVGTVVVGATSDNVVTNPLFGVHSWVMVVLAFGFVWWRQGMVMVPDGCAALITRFGKLEQVVGPGRIILLNPWKRVSYIINTTREYPFNAPVREAPTRSGVKASIDLFIQFRISDPVEFVYTLGAVRGFQEKLNNAVSETIRSLIYEQEAAGIYNMVGEDTGRLLEQLNQQFLPAVALTNANITHAEPSDRGYRMDLAAPEMVRVAKEAYTHEYALQLRKEQDEGDLTKELATRQEELSAIQADIAQYQAQMDTAVERETNRAEALARERYVMAESEARANAALLEAQALDIRAVTAAEAPEILEYRYQQQVLDTLEQVADHLPRLVRIGAERDGDGTTGVDFLALARQLVGERGAELFTPEDMAAVRARLPEVAERIAGRQAEIEALREADRPTVPAPVGNGDDVGSTNSLAGPAVGEPAGPASDGLADDPRTPRDLGRFEDGHFEEDQS
ncbi:SPFH domain-containing protein [Streptomyces sp. 3MP-14]|uniref:SPFH domain-containing protein n=1 Tax=Streptomyces mimosae TaxID=2586635 RepID=A0A5N5ZSR5_9ACTN|nr:MULTISPECIES: SPFH domain-containing protein [Streptomyces]KAB8159544.1 SPFH domain-containing protein [Streptomyces mimosae]KAB8172822.1 SPFH domain-containing protein [Streptomyces sp. 3MP-14]